jgi:hypothetical protein
MSSPFIWSPPENPFSFLTSSSLCGAGNPTADIECRLERAHKLARFAALYADTILIQDPFDYFEFNADSTIGKYDLIANLLVLEVLRPVIEAGIVVFAPTTFPLCAAGKQEFDRVCSSYRSRLEDVCDLILDEIIAHISFSSVRGPKYPYLMVAGTERFFGKEGIDLVKLPREVEQSILRGTKIPEDAKRELARSVFLDPVLDDLNYQHIVSWLYNVRYLTDRPIDSDILSILDDKESPMGTELSEALSHSLPFIDGLDTNTLVKLRKEEGEAFQVYRDRIRQLVKEQPVGHRQLEEALADLVRPELNRIDSAVRNAKKLAQDHIREKLIFGIGVVTLGIAAGTVAPEAGAVLSMLGGAKFGVEILEGLNELCKEPKEAKVNDFYFLWRMRVKKR